MALRASVEVEAGLAVVHQTADGDDVERVRRRAEGLTAAAGPGVVPVVRCGAAGDGGWELVTIHAGLPLDGTRVDGPGALAAIGAHVATTLARLHAGGLVHGRLEVEHIVVGRDGSPLLCGIDPGAAAPGDDVAALGRALALVAADLPPMTGADRERLAALERIAALASSEDPERRPTARRLANDLAAIAGRAASVPASTEARHPVAREDRRPPARLVALGGAALAVAAALAVGLAVRGGGTAPRAGVTATTASTAAPTTSIAPPECVATADRAVLPGDGCGSSVAVDGGALVVDGRRVVVGRVGDEVVAADWGCEGAIRPAVLRPLTGEVLVYASPIAGQPPEIAQAERVDGARRLDVRTGASGCAELLVVTEHGPVRLT